MPELALPLWFVSNQWPEANPDYSPCDSGGSTVAFTSVARFAAFMDARRAWQWKVAIAKDHAGLMLIVADLHAMGTNRIRLDPLTDGGGGEFVKLGYLLGELTIA